MAKAVFRVVKPGPLTLLQDQGRPGLAHLGVGRSGAMDRGALALANRLLGNLASSAGLEILLGEAEFECTAPIWVAFTGATGIVEIAGRTGSPRSVDRHTATLLEPGQRLRFGPTVQGIRYYLAARGGFAADAVLGSRSRDTLAALGPAPLAEGDVLEVGETPNDPIPTADLVPIDPPTMGPVTLELRPGPRRGWFGPETWRMLFESNWTVSSRSDRTGLRLDGAKLIRTRAGELASEGMIPGAIQVSPDGAPTILAVDHPVTGGYPVIAVVTDGGLDLLAQLRPGQEVKFRLATGR